MIIFEKVKDIDIKKELKDIRKLQIVSGKALVIVPIFTKLLQASIPIIAIKYMHVKNAHLIEPLLNIAKNIFIVFVFLFLILHLLLVLAYPKLLRYINENGI